MTKKFIREKYLKDIERRVNSIIDRNEEIALKNKFTAAFDSIIEQLWGDKDLHIEVEDGNGKRYGELFEEYKDMIEKGVPHDNALQATIWFWSKDVINNNVKIRAAIEIALKRDVN